MTAAVVAAMSMSAPIAIAEPITTPGFPGQCVDAGDPGQPIDRGALMRLAPCNGSPTQNFQFDQGTSSLRMPQQSPAQCFDLAGPPLNGTAVRVVPCNGSPAQRWAFPFDGRVRPVGVDPNKCLTHTTRRGKPSTGWVFDIVVVDPGCEFPEQGGGGFCIPTFAAFWEMMIATCDGRSGQSWRLAQPGFPFPSDGIVSTRTHVTVANMHIDDCREGGACDWKVHCGIGPEADVELVGKVEKNTGGTINIGRDLVHNGGLPVTVTCHVREFDRGIFDPDVWEVVGTATRTFAATGPASMGMDNSEGKVTLNFNVSTVGVIQQPSTVEPPPVAPTKMDTVNALGMLGFDFSVPETDLRQWLRNPRFTPYPAISDALVKLVRGKHLRRPVFLDVIVFNYEHAPGVTSPRRVGDVDMNLLARAVVDGHNIRYGETVRDFQTLLQ